MAPFGLPPQLYSSGAPLASLSAQQRESQSAAAAHSVAESSLKQRFLQGNMVAAPAEKKIAMYSRVRADAVCMAGGLGL